MSVLLSVPVSNEAMQASVMRGMQTPQRRSVEKLSEAVGRLFKFKARVELDGKGRACPSPAQPGSQLKVKRYNKTSAMHAHAYHSAFLRRQ